AEAGPLLLHVNLSAHHLLRNDLAAHVAAALRDSGLPPECLALEITESVLMHDLEVAIVRLHELRASGSTWPSTTSAPATRRWPTWARCRSTRSRSTSRSSTASPAGPRGRRGGGGGRGGGRDLPRPGRDPAPGHRCRGGRAAGAGRGPGRPRLPPRPGVPFLPPDPSRRHGPPGPRTARVRAPGRRPQPPGLTSQTEEAAVGFHSPL